MVEETQGKLVVRTRGGYRYEFPLVRDVTTLGRAPDCDLVLDDRHVSRQHARIERQRGRWILIDEGSRNGTIVEGTRIAGSHRLLDGQEIQIGNTNLMYTEGSIGDSTTRPLELSREQLDCPIQVDLQAWEARVEGKKLAGRLSVLEFKLLGYLYAHAGKLCSRDELCSDIWGEAAYTYEMLHQLVHRLKRRIEPDPENPRYILSVPGAGYKLLTSREP